MRPEELSSLIGEDATLHLLSNRGGRRMYVPAKITEELLSACGGDRDAATRLSAEHARNIVCVPTARRWRVMRMRERGFSVRQITSALSISERSVWRALAESADRSTSNPAEAA
ncbi:helix-turn-helix domain-containing protein [uncultured Bosea sp.]|uniref:helix-turn-helix domain-containing protein n=1 Tax=uncultured Bosea sp. TaxID=211457 RepID=UPI0025F39244|nr:helix-turn-helix domain-containing protein [uncultured Bosea sp.]